MTQYVYICDDGGTNVGTATAGSGIHTTQKTGAWSALATADYYATVALAMADWTPADGDIVFVAVDHAETITTGDGAFDSVVDGTVTYISVSMANCDVYERATTVQFTNTSSSGDWLIGSTQGSNWAAFGLYFKGNDNAIECYGNQGYCHIYQCTGEVTGGGDVSFTTQNYGQYIFEDCLCVLGNVNSIGYSVGNYADVKILGGTFSGGVATRVINLISDASTLEVYGLDLTTGLASTAALFYNSIDSRVGNHTAYNCKLGGSQTLATADSHNGEFTAINTASTSAAAEYQFLYINAQTSVEDESGIYRNATHSFAAGVKVSYKVATYSEINKSNPFVLTLQPRYADLTNAASDTLTVHFASADALDNSQVFAVVRYPTAADLMVMSHTDNAPTAIETRLGIKGTPTDYTDNAEGWTGAPANTYSLSVTTSGGAECAPVIDLYIAYDTNTNPLYVCPKIEVS